MRRVAILGLIAAGTVVLVANAQQQTSPRADFWPKIVANPVVKEWFSDIPWHQKLGTQGGNEIDEALILPFGALPDKEQQYCNQQKISEADCMIEFGVVNVLGMLRTDTPYDPTDDKIKNAPECKDPALPCIEVAIELQSYWSRLAGTKSELQPQTFGKEPPTSDGLKPAGANVYGGYVITDGSTYAPQMPWYMTHSCQAGFRPNIDMQDPVCYADYFSPMNDGFNLLSPTRDLKEWPRSVPWSVWPYNNPQQNHCAPDVTKCTMVMAAFDLREVTSNPASFQYKPYNDNLLAWFNASLAKFKSDVTPAELDRHFPWNGAPVTWETFLYQQAAQNPFLGTFDSIETAPAVPNDQCNNIALDGPPVMSPPCQQTTQVRAKTYLYPRQCELGDLAGNNIDRLRKCGVNYELHHNGFLEQWQKSYWQDYADAGMRGNQYGRTSFLFAGVPGMQMPVSFLKVAGSDLTIYEQVHNASIFSLFLPIANVADSKGGFPGRPYTDTQFYHTLLMSNHMEAEPELFAQGIRGKSLWHNEYRTEKMYLAYANAVRDHKPLPKFPPVMFAGSFDADKAKAPFHNNTCDACHLRNGSGVPIKPDNKLDKGLQEFMRSDEYNARWTDDYTFTGTIRPMKLVFFDLHRDTTRLDSSRYSEPLAFAQAVLAKPPRNVQPDDLYYNNKIMNYYGDSFAVKKPSTTYDWTYDKASADRLVVSDKRFNAEIKKEYVPWQAKLTSVTANGPCQIAKPATPTTKPWPADCKDVDGAAVLAAVNGTGTQPGDVGFMFLNGKRLGNLSVMEAIPNQAIIGFRDNQRALLGEAVAGEIIWNAGTRDGTGGKVQKDCRTRSLVDCYIGRFGWIGDRASLEDQVANAAFVEMNMTTDEGYKQLYGNDKVMFPLRYAHPNCGPANKSCIDSNGNGKLTEADVNRMADYARWVGNPTRSDFQVALDDVIAGEKIFRRVKCDTCHVINKISIFPQDTMVTEPYRKRLAAQVSQLRANIPFLSYIGTDLLMHDMGYLSQVGDAGQSIRDKEGVVLPQYKNYVQKIRTPALKGLQYNRYATESFRNTKDQNPTNPALPACDFLLHDGRACDAIEAAFLHDGPAAKKLGTIDALNKLSDVELRQLRAFLYSL